VLYKLATVGLFTASLHSCDEAILIFEHAGNSVFYQLLGVLAIGKGHLLEPCFDVGREMYFHAFKVRENRGLRQHGKQKRQKIRPNGSPVRPCTARTIRQSLSSALMISAARIGPNGSTAASLRPASRNTFASVHNFNLSRFIATSPF
jgi:hypothetical protein